MRFILALIVLACAYSNGVGDETSIDLDKSTFPSPDRKSVVAFESKDDGWYYLDLKNSKTGQVDSSMKIELTPLFSVQWTRDSKTIAIVSHVAHGSTATLFHFNGGMWSSRIVWPPDLDDATYYGIFCSVAKAEAEEHEVKLTYKITDQIESDSGGLKEKSYLVTLSIDPDTNKMVESKRTPID